jgi:hypothetical protein
LNEDTAVYTATGEVVATGYTATGETLVVSTVPIVTNDVAYWSFTNVSWSGAITARGALIYKVSGGTVCVLDFGSDKTSTTTFTVQFPTADSTSAIIRIA